MPYKDKDKIKIYYQLHKEEIRGNAKRHYNKNKEKMLIKNRKWRAAPANKSRQKEYWKRWNEKHPLKLKESRKKYFSSETYKNWLKDYKAKNSQKLREYKKKAVRELPTWYLRGELVRGTDLKPVDVPQELVELYKLKLIAERMLRNVK